MESNEFNKMLLNATKHFTVLVTAKKQQITDRQLVAAYKKLLACIEALDGTDALDDETKKGMYTHLLSIRCAKDFLDANVLDDAFAIMKGGPLDVLKVGRNKPTFTPSSDSKAVKARDDREGVKQGDLILDRSPVMAKVMDINGESRTRDVI